MCLNQILRSDGGFEIIKAAVFIVNLTEYISKKVKVPNPIGSAKDTVGHRDYPV